MPLLQNWVIDQVWQHVTFTCGRLREKNDALLCYIALSLIGYHKEKKRARYPSSQFIYFDINIYTLFKEGNDVFSLT